MLFIRFPIVLVFSQLPKNTSLWCDSQSGGLIFEIQARSDERKPFAMPLPVLEKAVSGRSFCRSTGDRIERGDWRVGMEAFRGGRITTVYVKPLAFLSSVVVEYAATGRSSDKATGEMIEKGEVRVVFASGSSKSYCRPVQAAPLVQLIVKTVAEAKGFDASMLSGMEYLEEAHRIQVAKVLSGEKAAARLRNPVKTGETPCKKRKAPPPKSLDDAESEEGQMGEKESDEDDDEGDDESESADDSEEPLELIWAKQPSSPWWPAHVGEPSSQHVKSKPAGGDQMFVIFFGPRASWAWVSSGSCVVPFRDHRTEYGCKSKVAAFKKALKQADDEAARQDENGRQVHHGGGSAGLVPVAAPEAVEAAATPAPPASSEEAPGELSEYEKLRLANIARNASYMASLGLEEVKIFKAPASTSQRGLQGRQGRKKAKINQVTHAW